MKRLLLALCALCAIFAATAPCFADATYGVLAEERVINLPQDSGKWYISVVGDAKDAQYQTILKWFNENPSLRKLKNQVHFNQVTTDTTMYRDRYSMNVKGLPTVRMQNSQGVVIYEAAGKNLPFTSEGLHGAIAESFYKVQGIRPILPWRRNHVCPGPCPQPGPNPDPNPDPDPQPIDDGGGTPVIDQPLVEAGLPPLWLMLLVLIASAAAGVAVQWQETYAKK
jgi:hypothetical protein